MYYLKLYFVIGFIVAMLFELILWLLKDDLDEKTKNYYSKYGGLIYLIKWPYIFLFLVKSLMKKN